MRKTKKRKLEVVVLAKAPQSVRNYHYLTKKALLHSDVPPWRKLLLNGDEKTCWKSQGYQQKRLVFYISRFLDVNLVLQNVADNVP